jgi:hypothetical protein
MKIQTNLTSIIPVTAVIVHVSTREPGYLTGTDLKNTYDEIGKKGLKCLAAT